MASGMVSLMPIVSGEGPLDPRPTPAVLNSRLPTLSARAIVAGETRPARICSDRREGGRGMAMELFGVGIWRWILLTLAELGAEAEISPTSEKMSPRSAYRLELKREKFENLWFAFFKSKTHFELFVSESVGLWSGA